MGKAAKTLNRVLRGTSDENIDFDDLRHLLDRLGFDERIRGDHHIFSKSDLIEIINIQPRGRLAKAYQVKQIRDLVLAYSLSEDLP